jgi:hypothetical protein
MRRTRLRASAFGEGQPRFGQALATQGHIQCTRTERVALQPIAGKRPSLVGSGANAPLWLPRISSDLAQRHEWCAYLWLPKISSDLAQRQEWTTLAGMIDFLKLLGGSLVGLFRWHAAREAEMALLRQQLLVLRRSAPARLRLRNADRLIFVWLYRLFPSLLGAAVIFKPETLLR